jgi:ATP-binding cassette subfamily C (CFTR/MRP) protein 1
VLKGLSFEIKGGEKIGIVGRTGAGKSTVSLSLTRIVEICDGYILIDGHNIADISLEQLRQKVTIIPQDPTLFTGSLRFNIDPENLSSDSEIKSLLFKAGLDHLSTRDLLSLEITENGENLSSGEKSLICICRAILRKNKVVILDEATANIDLVTE